MKKFDITLAGEINLDLILYGLPSAMETERELLASDFQMTLGSSSAILAHNLGVLGARVGFITRVGHDPLGRIAMERLQQAGVNLDCVTFSPATATGVTLLLPHGTERHILTYPGTIFELSIEHLDFAYLTSARHFHMSSFFLQRGLTPHLPELFSRIKQAGLTISLDTNDDPEDQWEGALPEVLKMVKVFLPNRKEACRIAGTCDVEEATRILADRIPVVVVKMGAQGALARWNEVRMEVPAVAVQAVDTIGAGDSFNAGFLSAYLQDSSLEACVRMGNLAGAYSTQHPGGTEAFCDRSGLRQFLATRSS